LITKYNLKYSQLKLVMIDDYDNQTDTFGNTANPKSSLLTDDIRLNLGKYGYSDQREEKALRLNSYCCCRITLIDNILKNMHKKWSNID
jgi:hypothetical protein